MSKSVGFSLIELLIALVIIGILAAIAYPAFQYSAYKSRRAEGKSGLVQLALNQEEFRANCTQYAGTLTGSKTCDIGAGTYRLGYSSDLTEGGHYSLSIQSASVTEYLLHATAQGIQAGDVKCFTLTLDQDGVRGALDQGGNPSAEPCW